MGCKVHRRAAEDAEVAQSLKPLRDFVSRDRKSLLSQVKIGTTKYPSESYVFDRMKLFYTILLLHITTSAFSQTSDYLIIDEKVRNIIDSKSNKRMMWGFGCGSLTSTYYTLEIDSITRDLAKVHYRHSEQETIFDIRFEAEINYYFHNNSLIRADVVVDKVSHLFYFKGGFCLNAQQFGSLFSIYLLSESDRYMEKFKSYFTDGNLTK